MTSTLIRERVAQLSESQRQQLVRRLQSLEGTNAGQKSRDVLQAFIVSDEHVRETDIKSWISKRLPTRIRPRVIHQLESLPLTSTGKVDRRRLADVNVPSRLPQTSEKLPTSSRILVEVLQIWQRVLGLETIDPEQDFFDAGGDSLDVIRVLALMSEADLKLTPSQFADCPTPTAQATLLSLGTDPLETMKSRADGPSAGRGIDDRAGKVIYLNSDETKPPLFFIPPKCRAASTFESIVGNITSFACYSPVLMAADTEDTCEVEDVLPEILSQVRRIQPQGPYRFVGNCEGAFVAWELARQLTADGEHVEFVGILDTPNPQAFVEKPLLTRLRLRLGDMKLRSMMAKFPSLLKRAAQWWNRRRATVATGDVSLSRPGTHMGWAFQPQPYDGSVCLFRCSRPGSSDFQDLDIDSLHGWDEPATAGLHVVTIPVSRDDMFESQVGPRMASEIEAAVFRSQNLAALEGS